MSRDKRGADSASRPRVPAPDIDAGVSGTELDRSVSRELTTLRAEAAEQAAKHLVMAGRLLDEEPELAYAHAMAARRCGPRVAVIREAVGVAAYAAGRWAEALAELRAARRISGDDEHWPMMADCERALGRPERALQMAAAPEVKRLSREALVEMRIVASGARADLGQLDAAVVTLQTAELQAADVAPWAARLRFAYAAALEAAGRHEEARQWYAKAAEVDPEGETDAAERLQELDGIRFFDTDEDEDDDSESADPMNPGSTPEEPTIPSEGTSSVPTAEERDIPSVEPASVPTTDGADLSSGGTPAAAIAGLLFLDAGLPPVEEQDEEDG